MQTEPIYKSVPTMRDYEEYKKAEQYTQGWNDAMHFIFSDEEKRKKLIKGELLDNCPLVETEELKDRKSVV